MKFGERAHLKLAREPQYPISLGKVRKTDGVFIYLLVCLVKQEKQQDMLFNCVRIWDNATGPFLFVSKSGHGRYSMEGLGLHHEFILDWHLVLF